jgi:hypothetical protein
MAVIRPFWDVDRVLKSSESLYVSHMGTSSPITGKYDGESSH